MQRKSTLFLQRFFAVHHMPLPLLRRALQILDIEEPVQDATGWVGQRCLQCWACTMLLLGGLKRCRLSSAVLLAHAQRTACMEFLSLSQ